MAAHFRCISRALPSGVLVSASLLIGFPAEAYAHTERPVASPARPGAVPDQARTPSVVLTVCKLAGHTGHFRHIQQAIDAAPDGALIEIWPGVYREDPTRNLPSPEDPTGVPADLPNGTFSFEYQLTNPHAQTLIAIVGKKNITLRGMGATPSEVVVAVDFKKYVGIRGDRADGLIIENFSVWHADHYGVYVLDTDGFIVDRVVSAYSREYGFLTFANDHGLISRAEAFGNGDGGFYPGGTAQTPGRIAMEVRHSSSHHNVVGLSGTNGNFMWVHDNDFFGNAVGIVSNSAANHPNLPQTSSVFERNRIFDNNLNPYDPDSAVASTVFGPDQPPAILIPVGTGIALRAANHNVIRDNHIWGHGRVGVALTGLLSRDWRSDGNHITGNRMFAPAGATLPNAVDLGWDGFGVLDCWTDNTRDPGGTAATDDYAVRPLPACTDTAAMSLLMLNPSNLLQQAGLQVIDGVPQCAVFGLEPCIFGPGPRPSTARNLPGGPRYMPHPHASCAAEFE